MAYDWRMSEGANWKISNRAKRWLLAIGGFVLLATIPALYIKSQCQAYGVQEPASYRIAIESPDKAQRSPGAKSGPITKLSLGEGFDGLIPAKERTEASYYAPKEPFDWWRHFLCEVNGADYVLALFTIVLALSTIFLWQETERLAEGAVDQSKQMAKSIAVAEKTAAAATKAAEVAEKSLIANDRAWIDIRPKIVGPLIFGSEEISIDIQIVLENVGKSPALNVGLLSETYGDVILANSKAREDINRGFWNISDTGRVLFPGNTMRHPFSPHFEGMTFTLKLEAFRKAIAEIVTIDPEDDTRENRGNPAIVLHAVYRLPAERAGKLHHTTIVYEILRARDFTERWDGSPLEIPASELILFSYLGSYAS